MNFPTTVGFLIFECMLMQFHNVLGQQSDVECGPNCVEVALHCLGVDFEYESFRNLFGTAKPEGFSMADLERVANYYGLKSRSVITDVKRLEKRSKSERFVCICWLANKHFVILHDLLPDNQVEIIDPPRLTKIPLATHLGQWDGSALLLSNQDLVSEGSVSTKNHYVMIFVLVGLIGLGCYGFWRIRK